MMRSLSLLAALWATALSAQVDLPDLSVQNSGGTLVGINEVKLMRVEPDGLRVSHATGMAKVPYERLPEALQMKYGFTPDKAETHRRAVKADAVRQAAEAEQALAVEKALVASQTAASPPQTTAYAAPTAYARPQTISSSSLSSRAATRIITPRMLGLRSSRPSTFYYVSAPSCTALRPCYPSTPSCTALRSCYSSTPSCTPCSPCYPSRVTVISVGPTR